MNLSNRYNYYFDIDYNPKCLGKIIFEPIGGLPASKLSTIDPQCITFLPPEQQSKLFLGQGDEPPVEYNDVTKLWWKTATKRWGADLTSKYVRVKSDIWEKVEQFYNEHMQGVTVLGAHIRGTDKSVRYDGQLHDAPEQFGRIIRPKEYFPIVELVPCRLP